MGNLFDQPSVQPNVETDQSKLYINKEEKLYLQSIYKQLLNNNNHQVANANVELTCINIEHVTNVFGNRNCPVFINIFRNYVMIEILSYIDFEKFILNCTRKSSSTVIQTFWNTLITNPDIDRNDLMYYFFYIIFELAYYTNHPYDKDKHHKSLLKDIIMKYVDFFEYLFIKNNLINHHSKDTIVDFNSLHAEINSIAPYISKVFESYISTICFPNVLQSPSYQIFKHPRLINKTSDIVNEYNLLPLALYSDTLQSDWQCLYSTSTDGISFNRIVHHILGYNGPTCMLIRCNDANHSIIGAYTEERWKECNRFYGSSKSFLFSLHPKLRIYRAKHGYASESSSAYQWLNTKSYSLPHGLGFGGSIDQFRLFIPDTLEQCQIHHSCPTYEDGKLLTSDNNLNENNNENEFEIQCLEIWGCGGKELIEIGLHSQQIDRANMDVAIQKARQVDKAAFFNNEFDKEFFLSNTMSHSAGTLTSKADV